MQGFGKIALMFGLLGDLMAYFIIPVQFSRKRTSGELHEVFKFFKFSKVPVNRALVSGTRWLVFQVFQP
jgi:hypothetical protein